MNDNMNIESQEVERDGFMDNFLQMLEGGSKGLVISFRGKMVRLANLPPAMADLAIQEAVIIQKSLLRVV